MNIVTRVTNQSAIDYYQISGSRRVDDPTRSPRKKIKNDHSFAKAGLLRGFYSTTKLPGGKSSTSVATTSIAVNPPTSPAKKCMNEPRIRFDEYRINLKAEMFKFCLVGKFPTAVAGATLEQVKEMASGEWNLQGGCSITLLDQSHLFIRLENEVDMIRVWPRNQCSVNGELMKIFKWTPMFRPSDGELPSAAVWMTLPSLPVVFYQEDLLCQIASLVGKVLGVDDATRNLTRTDSARVCVELDLLKEFPSKVWIEVGAKGFWQAIEYEEKPFFCNICSTVGHKTSNCKKKIEKASIDSSRKDTSRFEIKNCDARGEYFHTTPLFGDIKHAHSFRGGSEIMGEERNVDIVGSSSGQDVESVNSDADIEVNKKRNQPRTEPVMTIIEELLDGEMEMGNTESRKQGEVEMGNTESLSKTQNQENVDHGASSSKAKQSYSRRSNHTAKKQKLWRKNHSPEKPLAPGYSTRRFSFAEMKAASKCFKELIGVGGFGQVYKGKLGNDVVAIKRWSSNSHQGLKEFETELLLCGELGYCWHIVTLVGYCNENDELLLAYEYMLNGDLGKHLMDKGNTPPLSWAQRLVICIGAARGLQHLHSNGFIHRDVKSSNILMDHNWKAKLTDFGMSKLAMVNDESSTHFNTRIMGTFGYAEPCYIATGQLTYQSDVYSFGVVMLELLFGTPVIDAVGSTNIDVWRKSCRKEKILQADIAADIKGKVSPKCLKEYSALALKCSAKNKSDRPGMREVIDQLEFQLQLQRDYERERQRYMNDED